MPQVFSNMLLIMPLRVRFKFPELFLWHTFEALVSACATLEDFVHPNFAIKKVEVCDVVHRDIKPHNSTSWGKPILSNIAELTFLVFLGENCDPQRPSMRPYYPTPKLGDFGLALFTNKDDLRNPAKMRDAGTRFWKAPVSFIMQLGVFSPDGFLGIRRPQT